VRNLRERAHLSLLQVRVSTNEKDEPLWPRPLTPRGLAMLASGVWAIKLGVSYLREDAEASTVAYIGALLPAEVFASLWIVAGAVIIVLGPTRWWRAGMLSHIFLNAAWGVAAYFTYFNGTSARGDIVGDLYLSRALLLAVVMLMLNPPRPGTLPDASKPTGPQVPSRRGKGRSGG